jgi:hypothetical protein
MKEFMLFIKNKGNPIANLSKEMQQKHIQKVGSYIQKMFAEGKMKAAQPLEMNGSIISNNNGTISSIPFNETELAISGYYHILAKDLNEAMEIAKSDPRFEDGEWQIEVRPIMKIDGINE